MNNEPTLYYLDQMAEGLEKRISDLEKDYSSAPLIMKPLILSTLKLNKSLLEDIQVQTQEILSMPRT